MVRQRYSSTYVKRWREPKSRTNSRAISILHFVGEKFARALTMCSLRHSKISGTFWKSLDNFSYSFVPFNRSIKYLYCVRVSSPKQKRSNHDVHFSSTTTTQLIMIEIIAGSVPYLDNPPFVFAVPIWQLTRIRRRWCIRCDDTKI